MGGERQKGRRKTPDYRPARARYWERGRLQAHKVKALQREAERAGTELSEQEAIKLWRESRGGRRMRTQPRKTNRA